jgi:hypothetical protein
MKRMLVFLFIAPAIAFLFASCRSNKKEVMTVIPDTPASAPHASPSATPH